MRDKNLNSIFNFERSMKNFIERKLTTIEILRTAVIDSPTFLTDFYFDFPRKLYQIRGLCIIVHYLPDILRYRIILDLEERIYKFSLKEQLELKILLSSKENMIKFLFLTQKYSSHEIFGNIVNDGIKSLKVIRIRRKNLKIVKPIRKRGYDDKGSLRSSDRWLPSFDISFIERQNQIEKEKYLHQKSLDRIINFLEKIVIDQ